MRGPAHDSSFPGVASEACGPLVEPPDCRFLLRHNLWERGCLHPTPLQIHPSRLTAVSSLCSVRISQLSTLALRMCLFPCLYPCPFFRLCALPSAYAVHPRCACSQEVMIVANDATVKGGAYYPITVKKHLRAQVRRAATAESA
jgi:hypothetical protein